MKFDTRRGRKTERERERAGGKDRDPVEKVDGFIT